MSTSPSSTTITRPPSKLPAYTGPDISPYISLSIFILSIILIGLGAYQVSNNIQNWVYTDGEGAIGSVVVIICTSLVATYTLITLILLHPFNIRTPPVARLCVSILHLIPCFAVSLTMFIVLPPGIIYGSESQLMCFFRHGFDDKEKCEDVKRLWGRLQIVTCVLLGVGIILSFVDMIVSIVYLRRQKAMQKTMSHRVLIDA